MAYKWGMTISAEASAVSADLLNVPLALVLTSSNLATTANGGHIENTDATGGASGALTVPADFVVSPNNDGSEPYDFEIVDYDPATGAIELWVEVRELSSTEDTLIYLVYGDPNVTVSQENVAGTWANGFEAVYHFAETSGSPIDSTLRHTGEVYYGDLPDPRTGKIGTCQHFDGSYDYFDGNYYPTAGSSNRSMFIWANTDPISYDKRLFFYGWFTDGRLWDTYLEYNNTPALNVNGSSLIPSWTITEGSWFRFGASLDGNTLGDVTLYLNDQSYQDETETQSINTYAAGTETALHIGYHSSDSDFHWEGYLDEVWMMDEARGADFAATTYRNQDASVPNGLFWSALGPEQRFIVISAGAAITDIENPQWVSPPNGGPMHRQPTLVFTMPDSLPSAMHFQLQVDTVDTFDSANRLNFKTNNSQDGWEYWDGSQWQPFPSGGVSSAYSGNECRYTLSQELEVDTYYRRVRAGDAGVM